MTGTYPEGAFPALQTLSECKPQRELQSPGDAVTPGAVTPRAIIPPVSDHDLRPAKVAAAHVGNNAVKVRVIQR